ncbi:EamA family transporter [Vulcanisaeta sp. EB80]|uniref:DMT family transporter n=1 Tax=Vulcanisaeta sp. EB80 TaxID=1650660 RepID=UPI0009BEA5CE|nr:DMT family transporter [Vulcanisaeta sp. EB80]PLC69069.1 EamA family transporter [Vulcanisaeta sp. EB80]
MMKHYVALTVAVIAISWASILILLSGAQPVAVAFWRSAIAAVALTPLFIIERENGAYALRSNEVLLVIVSGVALAVHFMTWIESLYLTTVAASTTLVSTYPIFTLIMDRLIGERVGRHAIIGTLTAFLGVVLITTPEFFISLKALVGDLLALIGAVAGAVYFMIGRVVRVKVSLATYTVPVYSVSALVTLITGLFLHTRFWPYPLYTWFYIVMIVLGPMLLGHTLLNYTLRYSRAITVTTSTLGEPIGATLLALLIFRQIPQPLTVVGMVVTLLGIYMVIHEELNMA